MTQGLDNPDLNDLVRELNLTSEREVGEGKGPFANAGFSGALAAGGPAPDPRSSDPHDADAVGLLAGASAQATPLSLADPAQRRVEGPGLLGSVLEKMLERRASDLHLVPGLPLILRIDDRLLRVDGEAVATDGIATLFGAHLGPRELETLRKRGAVDFSLRLGDSKSGARSGRFRINVHRQQGVLAANVRALPREVPTLASLNLPPSLTELVRPRQGLVIVCGPTGSGKTSTLAALIGEINRHRASHVVTIEEPIEYRHPHRSSVIEQIEIGVDSPSFAEALRASLRQDPDVVLVGEMRDLETISTALTAAETGHLILSTLHTSDVVQAVHRMVDVFPASGQSQIRQQLALSLQAIVSQRLIPRRDGAGRVPAVEVLKATYPVRQHIRSDKLQRIYNEITLGQRHGMVSMESSLAQLVSMGQIEVEEARVRSTRPDELESLLG